MQDVALIWEAINRNLDLAGSSVSIYPFCYTTDLIASVPDNKFFIKNISASGSDSSKDISLKKALMELVERVVFIKEMDRVYSKGMGRVSSKGWACHPSKARAKEQAVLEFYEDQCIKNAENISEKLKNKVKSPANDNDFNFMVLKIDKVFFSAVWFLKDGVYSIGSACATSSAQSYKKSLQEAYVKWKAGISDSISKVPVTFPTGYYELDVGLPEPSIEPLYDDLLNKLNLYMFKATECKTILH